MFLIIERFSPEGSAAMYGGPVRHSEVGQTSGPISARSHSDAFLNRLRHLSDVFPKRLSDVFPKRLRRLSDVFPKRLRRYGQHAIPLIYNDFNLWFFRTAD